MKHRDYGLIAQRLEALAQQGMAVKTVGHIETYPVYAVELSHAASASLSVLITAGVHGNEPSGVEAVLRFLEQDQAHLLEHVRFFVLPCINPAGYVDDTRENRHGQDINRAFDSEDTPEAQIVKATLRGRQFDWAIDLHEDWEATGFYLYEGRHEGPLLGDTIIEHVREIGPIAPDDPEDPPDTPAVYPVAASWGTQGLTSYVLKFHAAHVLISEAPTDWAMETRVAAHFAMLDTVLAHYLEAPTPSRRKERPVNEQAGNV